MKLLRPFDWLLPLMALLSVLAFSVAEEDLLLLTIAAPLIAASWFLSPPSRPSEFVPRWAINIAVILATVHLAAAWRSAGINDSVTVLSRYLVWLLVIKLFDVRTPRDVVQIVCVSVMLVIGACLTSVSADLGAVLLLYVPTAVATIACAQLHSAAWRARAGGDRAGASGPRAGVHLRRMIALPTFLILAIAAFVFIVTPRSEQPGDMLPWQPNAKQTRGIGNQMQLGGEGLLSDSREVVATVRVSSDHDPTASGRKWLLRAVVLDQYDPEARVWRASRESTDPRASFGGWRPWKRDDAPPESTPQAPLYRFTVSQRDQMTGRLLAPWKPVALAFPGMNLKDQFSYQLNGFTGLASTSMGSFYGEYHFDVYVNPMGETNSLPLLAGDTVRDRTRVRFDYRPHAPLTSRLVTESDRRRVNSEPRHPFIGTRIEGLARWILSNSRYPIDLDRPDRGTYDIAASALRMYLEKNFDYTTVLSAPDPAQDPIEMFLFDADRGGKGHCEYFAAALVAMCQSVGIPARVVMGYAVEEYDPVTRHYTVRQSHAHAWAEVEIRPGRWREYDPSPRSDVSPLADSPHLLLVLFRRSVSFFQLAWVRSVVSFDRDQQAVTLRSAGSTPLSALRAMNDLIASLLVDRSEQLAARSPALAAVRTYLWVLVISTVCAVTVMLLVSRGRAIVASSGWAIVASLSGRRAADEGDDSTARAYTTLYRRLIDESRRAGIIKPAHATPLAFARAASRRDEALGGRVGEFTGLYYRARFARDPEATEQLTRAESLVDEASSILRTLRRERAKKA